VWNWAWGKVDRNSSKQTKKRDFPQPTKLKQRRGGRKIPKTMVDVREKSQKSRGKKKSFRGGGRDGACYVSIEKKSERRENTRETPQVIHPKSFGLKEKKEKEKKRSEGGTHDSTAKERSKLLHAPSRTWKLGNGRPQK